MFNPFYGRRQPICILYLLIVQIYFGGAELICTVSISPYPVRLGKILKALCCLLPVATQQVCKFSSADCQLVVGICLRTSESGNQLGNCFIWDIAIEVVSEREVRKLL